MITNIEDYFTKGCGRCARFDTPDCVTHLWHRGLADLRRICRAAGLQETVKWGHPCYMSAGRNIVMLGAFLGDFRINFFHAALMKDPDGLLTKQGPNSQHASMMRFTDAAQVAASEPVIFAYLKEAIGYADAGIKPAFVARDIEIPDELTEALDDDPELADAFHGLTPGRQESYVIHLASTQNSDTRRARIARFRGKVLSGKGATER